MATILCDLDGTLLRRLPGEDPTPKRVAMNAALAEVSGLAGVDYRQGIAGGVVPRPGSPAAWLADLADACAVVAQVADLARAA